MANVLLLLGAGGFAGEHFVQAAQEAGVDVVRAGRSEGFDLRCDLLDPASVERALSAAAPDTIVNLAGASSVAASFRQPVATFESNATGVLNLLDAAARQAPDAHILCVSSGEIYGSVPKADLPVTEDRSPAPRSPYGTSKAAMEVICGSYERAQALRIAVIRAFNHTGPGQSDAFAASSFSRQIAEAERRGMSEVSLRVGDLTLARDFTDVRDIVQAYRQVVENGITGTYNACSGRPTRIGELVEHLQRATELPVKVTVEPRRLRQSEAAILYGSSDRLRGVTGWRTTIPLEKTMEDLLAWWRERVNK